MDNDFKSWMTACQGRVDKSADEYLPKAGEHPAILHEAMRYAVIGGGKRVRPLLVYAVADIQGGKIENADKVGLAVECIHSYSLIHDDLPCMDNDVLRHGKPTSHVRYGEAMAMLAGDALQPEAFLLIGRTDLSAQQKAKLIELLAFASSSRGMCGGQAVDLSMVGKKMNLEELRRMHEMKTGALLFASVLCGAYCGREDLLSPALVESYSSFGKSIGLLFQIVDDILDVVSDAKTLGKTAGKDALEDKPTYVSILGLEKARELAGRQYEDACAAIDKIAMIIGNEKTGRLQQIADLIYKRRN